MLIQILLLLVAAGLLTLFVRNWHTVEVRALNGWPSWGSWAWS